ncbi:GDSL esterase/lipase At1g74460-like [Phalaenopsis equestris]|uniref:GDSL esterase/lipase At1g74460-like n=1 Tax=Phalaenopsis equestris TaxID=78828 RepID=UPI0009E5BC18|nr:GDSL esterase/lipase At1g74460-like [Phalaenopsis equestris]
MAMLLLASIVLEDTRCSSAMVLFIFGDSLSDVGNNYYLTRSLARPALPWYGIDFGDGLPSGRFTNGRTIADIVGEKMGLPRPPPFLDPSLDEDTIINQGVNYASGGGGILNETGSIFIQRYSFWKQIELFKGTQEMIRRKIGKEAADKFFQQALYVVAMGSNDYINNFLLPFCSDSWNYDGDTFTNYLITTLESQLRVLHSLGVRQMTFFGLGPLGCIPLQRFFNQSGQCQESTNKLALKFNSKSVNLLENLSKTLPNVTFKFVDAYNSFYDLINRPKNYGFTNVTDPCCSIGNLRASLTCTPLSRLCKDRSKYVFWDAYHPTERANAFMAHSFLNIMGIDQKPTNETI